MREKLKNKIKQTIASNPDSIIFYHEDNEWSIYPSSVGNKTASAGDRVGRELLEGNDYHNKKGYAPELVVALAELLGIKVISNNGLSPVITAFRQHNNSCARNK